jgi:type II secretory ATPase GspE/PulE/Tfp pilus assembly ATPase PilB-like protein
MSREDEAREAPKCPHCRGKGCNRCQHTGYAGGREP